MINEGSIVFEAAGWAAPPHVNALTTLRTGGVSEEAFDSLNLAAHVGDDPVAVKENRTRLVEQLMLPSEPIWLNQEHGHRVVKAEPMVRNSFADGSYTLDRRVLCAILTADCMPLFLTDRLGSTVCLLHIGWRGLSAGIIEKGLNILNIEPQNVLAWIGPGIGRDSFMVGSDVREKLIRQYSLHREGFVKHKDRWLADLGMMIEQRLDLAGVQASGRSKQCTLKDPSAWFSYRRDGCCGRMASLIWLD